VQVAIAGAAEAQMGLALPGMSASNVMAQAARDALRDAGLQPADVDGVFAASTQLPWASVTLAEELGIVPRHSDSTMLGGASPMAHLAHARAAIAAGLCEVAVIAYGSTQRSLGRSRASVQELDPWEAPYAPLLPVTAYALAASRHMHEFGTTPEQLAWVAVSARQWAQRNPDAWSREELTIADVLAAPRVCDPLGVRDCCLVTDGGAALVVTSLGRAKALRHKPVVLLGAGEAHSHRHISAMPDLTTTAAVQSGQRAFAEAGLRPADVQCAQLYDAFTITPILFLEDLGFCAKGEGGAFVADGRIAPGGELPVNTSGGGLSYAHPGMNGLPLLVEAVRQVRREGRDVVLAHGNGGVLSAQATVLLGSEDAGRHRPRQKRVRLSRPAAAGGRARRGPVVRVGAR
jgi:acetyl-CoA acetyltransferase